jgi:hypothetical protein
MAAESLRYGSKTAEDWLWRFSYICDILIPARHIVYEFLPALLQHKVFYQMRGLALGYNFWIHFFSEANCFQFYNCLAKLMLGPIE